MFNRLKVAMVAAELMGVMVLVTAVYSMIARTSFPLFAGLAAGTVLALLVHTIGATSGAHVNPAITLGLWSIRKVKTITAIIYIAFQMLGGYLAFLLINYFLGHNLESIANQFEWKVFIAEATGALIFGFGVASAVYQKYEGGKLAFTIGASLTIGILVASLASNGLLNPAVAVGIQSWNWAYATGPLVGSILGMNIYALLFAEETLIKRAAVTSRSVRLDGRFGSFGSLVSRRPATKTVKRPVTKKKPASRKRR